MKKYLLTLYFRCGIIIEKELTDDCEHKVGNAYAILKYYMENKTDGIAEIDNLCFSISEIVALEITELEE